MTLTLGGSEIPAVIGLDPYVSPYALACRKLGVTGEPEGSVASRLGNALEAAHLQLLADEGRDVAAYPGVLRHEQFAWLVGHPDAFEAVNGAVVPVELKLRGVTPSDALRQRDTVQALVYAELLSAPYAVVSVLHGGYGGFSRDEWQTERDPELFAMIVERCERFLALVARGKCPPPDGSESARDAIRERFADANEHRRIRLTASAYDDLQAGRAWAEVEANARQAKERCYQRVQDHMGEAVEAISPTDVVVARWRPVTSRKIDTARLRRDHPALASEYESQSTYRRFEANV